MAGKDISDKASESGKLHSYSLIWGSRKSGGNEGRILKCIQSYVVLFLPTKNSYYVVEMFHL